MKGFTVMLAGLLFALRVCAADGVVLLDAANAKIDAAGGSAKYEPADNRRCVGYWKSTNTVVNWSFELKERGTYRVIFVYATIATDPGPEVEVTVGGQKANGFAKPTGDWGRFADLDLGPVLLRKPGTVEVAARVTRMVGPNAVNLRAVKLVKEP